MQPLAAYYVFLANDEARQADAHRPYRSVAPTRSGRSRVGAIVAALIRPVRRFAAAAA